MEEYKEEKMIRVTNLHIKEGEIIITYEDGEVRTIYTNRECDEDSMTNSTNLEGVRILKSKIYEVLLKLNRLF